ncbi:MAG: asparaginase domain-containing protein [Rickettsiales bacterium]
MGNHTHNQKVLVVVTGGTIDARYDPAAPEGTPHDVPVPIAAQDSCIPSALEKLGFKQGRDFEIATLPDVRLKDSKFITPHDLDMIVDRVRADGFTKVMVVHGTDTMPNSGIYLQEALTKNGLTDVRVVLTGGMYPLNKTPLEESQHPKEEHWRGLDAAGKPILINVLPHKLDGSMDLANACDGWLNLKNAMEDVRNPELKAGVYIRVNPQSIEIGDGPWHASMLRKYVVTDAPGTTVGKVLQSGFVVRSAPATAQEISFNF